MKKTLSISIQEEEAQKIRELAILQNKTVSEYVRSVIREKWMKNS